MTFLLAGISVECLVELLAHKEAKVARLTTSKTKAMNHPFFATPSVLSHASQKECSTVSPFVQKWIKSQLALRQTLCSESLLSEEEKEWIQTTHPGVKAVSLCYTMSLPEFHRLFLGRLPSRYEM